MAFGADSDGRERTYRVYSRQTKDGPFALGHHKIEATADNIDERFETFLNGDTTNYWVRWFLLVAEDGRGAFPYRASNRDGRWIAERI